MNTTFIVPADEVSSFAPILAELDEAEYKKERSHKRKRDFRSLEDLDVPQKTSGTSYKPAISVSLNTQESYVDIIFSENFEDIHELVTDGMLSRIIKQLTPTQKNALHMIAVQRYSTKEAAAALGVSTRNVCKLYSTALFHIRGKLYPVIKLRYKLENAEKYQTMARERNISTIIKEREFIETADKSVKRYYGEMTSS